MCTPLRIQDSGYTNWMKCSLSLILMKEGLHSYVDTELKNLHLYLKHKVALSTGRCSSCTFKDVRRTKNNPLTWYITCGSNVCNRWLSEILSVHTDPHSRSINWKNADISQWPTNPYEIAKVYMPKGQDRIHNLPQELDAAAILSLLKYCTWFSKNISNTKLLSDLIDIRNEVMHSGELKVSEIDKDKWIGKMIQLLSDLNINGPAQSEIHKVKSEDIDISFREIEIRVLQNLVTGLDSNLAELSGEINSLCSDQFEQTEKLANDLEETKKSLYELEKVSYKIISFLEKISDIVKSKITGNIRIINQGVHNLQSQLSKIEQRLSSLENQQEQQKEAQNKLEKHQDGIQKQLESVDTRVAAMERRGPNSDQKEIDSMREDLKSCYKTLSTISIAPLDDEQTILFKEFFIDLIIEYQTEIEGWNTSYHQLLSYKQVFLNKDNQRIILTGLSGSGKSTFCKKIVNVWCKEEQNRLVDTAEISDPAISDNPKGTTEEEISHPDHFRYEAVTDKEKEWSVYNNSGVTPDEDTSQYVPDSSELSIRQVTDQSVIDSSGAIADENIFSQFSLLFYIYAPKISCEENLIEVLYNQCLKRKSDQLLKILQEQPENILLILDGMDEMGDHIPKLVLDLLERKLYPRIIVMIAMRPWMISKLQLKPLSHYDLLLDIQGMSERNALKFVQKVIDLNSKHTKMEMLHPLPKEVAVLSSFRNVPLLLLFLAHSWCQDQCLPTRQQDLYKQILNCLIKRCLSKTGNKYVPALTDQDDMNRKKVAFWELYVDSACTAACHCLLQGVSGSSFVILEKDLKTNLGNDAELKIRALLDCGILSKLNAFSPLEKKVSITFLHLSIQEYLTSMNLVNNEDAFQNFLTGLKTLNDVLRHENLFIFICGLDAGKGHRAFVRICQVCDEDSHVIQYRQGMDYDGQILSSVENLNKMYKACLNEIVSEELVEIPDIVFSSLDERSMLMISRLKSSFVKSLCLSFNDQELHYDVLDLRSLINVVSLKFWNVTMSEKCSSSLCKSISDCTHLETLELKDITLYDSVLDVSSLVNLTSLSLGEVAMSKECVRSLCCSIIGCTHLERLELMGITLHDDVLDFSSMTSLISLNLRYVSMSEEYSTSVCQSISHCNRLERLKLKWIKLHDGVLDLTRLNKLTSLELWHVNMSDNCGRVLCSSIYNCTHLEWLDLRGITLHDSILNLKSLKNLILIDVSMSEECSRTLCSTISTCSDLDSLEVKDTMLHDGVIDLSCLTKLTTLSLWKVTLSEECSKSLCGSISGCVHLKFLQLVDIELHESIFDLSRLTNLNFLKMDDVIISEACSVHLCRSISKCTQLKTMQLERIKLYDGVLDLRRLTKLTSLALYNVTMSEECSRSLCCNIRYCKHLNELQLRGSFRGASLALHGGVLDLRHLTNLSSLTLDDVIMSKECCKSLCSSISDCTRLEELQLIDVTLHDGVLDLCGLSDLNHLKLSGVIMTTYCEQTLKASLKHCQKLQSVAFE